MIVRLRNLPFKYWMVIATAISITINFVVLAFTKDANIWGDAYYYHHGANLIAQGKGWIEPLSYLRDGIAYQAADHPPAHLALLALFSYVGLDSVGAHQFATILTGVVAIPFFGLAGRRLGGHAVGVVTALIASVHAGFWGWNKMVHSEPSAILGVVLLLLAAFRVVDNAREGVFDWKNLAILGCAAGFATQTRAELGLSGALIIIVVLIGRPLLSSAKKIVAAALVFALTLSPWVLFNLSRFDSPVYLSTGFEITFASANCPLTYDGQFKAYWAIQCVLDYKDEVNAKYPNADRSQYMKELGKLATAYVKDHKTEFAKLAVLKIGRVVGLYRLSQQMILDTYPEGRDRYVVRLAWGTYFALLPFSIVGGYLLRDRKRKMLALLTTIGVVLVTCVITFGNTRYRITAEPALVMMASVGIVAAANGVKRLWNTPDTV